MKVAKKEVEKCLYGSCVYLRPVIIEDAPIIRKWHNDPDIINLSRMGEEKTTLEQEREDIKTARKSNTQAYHLITTQSDNTPVGFLRFNFIDKSSGNVWLRMIIGNKKAQGKGYAREALQLCLQCLFGKLRVHRITLECYSTNLRAIRFYKKMGFRKGRMWAERGVKSLHSTCIHHLCLNFLIFFSHHFIISHLFP